MKTDTQKSQDELIAGAYKHNAERLKAARSNQVTAPAAGHTPGPWTIEAGEEYAVRGANKQIVFLIGDNRRAIPMGQDGRLIAAAPELLGALQQLEWAHSHLLADRGCVESILSEERLEDVIRSGEIARAAIAKAKGTS